MMKSVGVVVVLLMALSAVHAYVALPMRSRTFENLENAAKRRRSTDTAVLSGCPSSDFSVEVTLGSSGQTQTFELIVDTGSSTLAVAGNGCCGTSSSYTTSLHTTAKDLNAQVTSTYGDGSGWTGTVYTDTVNVGGVSVSMNIAVQTSQNSFYNPSCSSSSPLNQGIMGMAYENLAVSSGSTTTDSFPNAVEVAATSSVLSGKNAQSLGSGGGLVFGLQMCATTGQLFLGADTGLNGYGLATTAPVYIPITQQVWYVVDLTGMSIGSTALPTDFGTTIVDSGTTQLVVPQDVLTAIENVVNANSVFASVFGSGFLSGSECKSSTQTTAQLNAALPTLTFTLSGYTFTVPAINSYLQQVGTGSSAYYCPGIGAGSGTTILGWSFINNFIVIFDRTQTHGSLGAIGIAPTTSCGSSSTVTGGSGSTSAPTTAGTTKAPTAAPTTAVTYTWSVGSFGFCSATCGGGTETRTVSCVSNTGVVDTTGTKCSASPKPATSQSCNTQACTTAAPVGTNAPASPSATSCALRCGTYSSTATCNCDSYCTYYKDCCTDLSTACAATTAPVATVKATTAPTVSGATAKPTTPKVSATANPALCLSAGVNNCGVYSPTRSCECDSLCSYYGDCCSDYTANCASGSLGFDSLYSRRNGTVAGSGSKSDARALSASLFTIFAAFAFLIAML